jgi:hypothetical protein
MIWIKQESLWKMGLKFKKALWHSSKIVSSLPHSMQKMKFKELNIIGSANSYCWAEQLETHKWCKTHHTDLLLFNI